LTLFIIYRLLSLTKFKRLSCPSERIGNPTDLDAPKSTTRLPFLPPEILSIIFSMSSDHSGYQTSHDPKDSRIDLETLYQCSLVGNRWNVSPSFPPLLLSLLVTDFVYASHFSTKILATPHLYRYVGLRKDDDIDSDAFSSSLQTYPERASFVRVLDIGFSNMHTELPPRLGSILHNSTFSSLTSIVGLVLVSPFGTELLDALALRTPCLRDLEFTWRSRDTPRTQDFETINLPSSMQILTIRLDCMRSRNEEFLRRLVETGEVTSDGVVVRRLVRCPLRS